MRLQLLSPAEFWKLAIPETPELTAALTKVYDSIYGRRWLCATCSASIEVQTKARRCACEVCGGVQFCCQEFTVTK